ncbi:MAG TPA: hypothetical protein VEA59_03435 [Patescibacteria group bacterium]|nr:hypothetical protein [Patescibacteria group bacterium]
MFKLIGYAVAILAVAGFVWLYPKYDFVQKNPGYCTKIVDHIFYCGSTADLEKFFSK